MHVLQLVADIFGHEGGNAVGLAQRASCALDLGPRALILVSGWALILASSRVVGATVAALLTGEVVARGGGLCCWPKSGPIETYRGLVAVSWWWWCGLGYGSSIVDRCRLTRVVGCGGS
jgi:hypothetical protein